MTTSLQSHISQSIPKQLWHYTSVEALEGILTSQRLFATEARHTTDPNEFIHARAIAQDYLDRLEVRDARSKRSYEAARDLLNLAFGKEGLFSPGRHDVYIVSFSASKDKRSQWNLYAGAGSGVSIAFDLTDLRPLEEIESGVTLAPCVYSDKQKEVVIEDALSIWTRVREELWYQSNDRAYLHNWLKQQLTIDRIYGVTSSRDQLLAAKQHEFSNMLGPAITRAAFNLLRVASLCKEGKFLDEDEWRLALPHQSGKEFKHTKLLYRGPAHDVPYITTNLFSFRLPITEIMLGPTCTLDTKVKLLARLHTSNAVISRSRLTF